MGRVKDMFFTDTPLEWYADRHAEPEPEYPDDEDDGIEYVYSEPIVADRKLYDSDELPF